MPDIIEIEILEDGVISVKTGDVSETNHMSADNLLDELHSSLGGERESVTREHPFMKDVKVLRGGKIVRTVDA